MWNERERTKKLKLTTYTLREREMHREKKKNLHSNRFYYVFIVTMYCDNLGLDFFYFRRIRRIKTITFEIYCYQHEIAIYSSSSS